MFFSNASSYNTIMTLMGGSSLLLLLIGGSRFSGLDLVSVFSSIILFIIVFNSMTGYVLNK